MGGEDRKIKPESLAWNLRSRETSTDLMWAWPSLWGQAQAHPPTPPPATTSCSSASSFPDICAVSGPVCQEEVACPLGLD